MIILINEDLGCAHSIDYEGCLFFVPLNEDGSFNPQDWNEVEFWNIDDDLIPTLKEVQEKLIAMNKLNGTYYTLH